MKFFMSLGIGLVLGAIIIFIIDGTVHPLAIAWCICGLLIGLEQTILDIDVF